MSPAIPDGAAQAVDIEGNGFFREVSGRAGLEHSGALRYAVPLCRRPNAFMSSVETNIYDPQQVETAAQKYW
ncbi:MAG: hypothetical protein J0H45_08180, partial [Stenotrophomonas nitritireducens]|nr:hypothetical protein [Stenotrophomonas nitritireducens]